MIGVALLSFSRHACELRLRLAWAWKRHVDIDVELGHALREHRALPLPDALAELGRRLMLDRLDLELLAHLAVLEREPQMGLQVGELLGQLGRTSPSPALVALGFGETDQEELVLARLAPWSALVTRGFVELEGSGAWTERRLSLSELVSGHLFERVVLPDVLRPLAYVMRGAEHPLPNIADAMIDAARAALMGPARVIFEGPPGAGRKQLAASLTRGLVVCELGKLTGDEKGFAELVRMALCTAWLEGAVAYFDLGQPSDPQGLRLGGESGENDAPVKLRPSPRERRVLDHLIADHPRAVAFGVEPGDQGFLPAADSASTMRVTITSADLGLQASAWRHASDTLGQRLDGELFARRFPLSLRALKRITRTVQERRRSGLRADQPLVEAQAREFLKLETGMLARPITSELGWNDLVLPPTLMADLREVIALLKTRELVMVERGMRRWGRGGFHLLLAGEPGTGKTTIATLLGRELNRETLQVNLDQVFSRYVGETEKHLVRVFSLAERSRSLLLLDEADALLARRTDVKDANDRFGNLAVNVVLQLMETYDVVSVATTNRDAGLDDASLRRFAYRFTVPPPDVDEREQLFKRMVPPFVVIDPAVDWRWFAEHTQVSGGLIRNIMMRMAGLAAANGDQLTLDVALRSVNRELTQLGRLPLRAPTPSR